MCKHFADEIKDGKKYLLIMGDFNDTPDSQAILNMKLNGLECLFNKLNKEQGVPECPLTTHKARKGRMTTRTIDYMFFNQAINMESSVNRLLNIPFTVEDCPKSGNPTANHPSDHYSLGVELLLSK